MVICTNYTLAVNPTTIRSPPRRPRITNDHGYVLFVVITTRVSNRSNTTDATSGAGKTFDHWMYDCNIFQPAVQHTKHYPSTMIVLPFFQRFAGNNKTGAIYFILGLYQPMEFSNFHLEFSKGWTLWKHCKSQEIYLIFKL